MKRWMLCLLLCMLCTGCAPPRPDTLAPGQAQRLTVYTAHKPDVYAPIIEEFEMRTGIWVDVESGGTQEMLERIEREADAPRCDVMFGGGAESLEAAGGLFAPCAGVEWEALHPAYVVPGSKWVPFSSLPVVLIYNPRLIGDDPPAGWASLMEPRFWGRIAFADPAVSGSSYTALYTMLEALGGEAEKSLDGFIENLDGRVLAGSGDVVGAVAGGACLVGVTLEETAKKAIAAGADIALVYPAEGTSAVPDGAAIVRGAPHGQNAAQFLRFILSHDVQSRLHAMFFRRPVRVDLAMAQADTPGLTRIGYDIPGAGGQKAELLAAWRVRMEAQAP